MQKADESMDCIHGPPRAKNDNMNWVPGVVDGSFIQIARIYTMQSLLQVAVEHIYSCIWGAIKQTFLVDPNYTRYRR